jgi:superfamily II DNA helicase RecQ
MDIPDIECVIQFMVPASLSVLTQRFGQAGCAGQQAIAILLAEPSVFQMKKTQSTTLTGAATQETKDPVIKVELLDEDLVSDDHDDTENKNVQYKKNIETGMRKWCDALTCRREVSNKYFENPPSIACKSIFFFFFACLILIDTSSYNLPLL